MKIINLELIDTFTLSLEDVDGHGLSQRDRKDYAFQQCVSQVMKDDYCDYAQAYKIVEDSLTYLQVDYTS